MTCKTGKQATRLEGKPWVDGRWVEGKCTLVGVTTQQGTTENALIREACSPEAAAVYEEKMSRKLREFLELYESSSGLS